jgi:hypothetical protein
MTALTNKQRVKVNAALTIVHSNGGDASAVTAHAKRLQTLGHSARTAYEVALNTAVQSAPDMGASIERSIRLIEASDDATVAKYDSALSSYNQTGSDAELKALAPMIAQDSAALAIRMGEMTHDDIANGGLASALGFDPDDGMVAAAMSAPPTQAAPQAPGETFAFKDTVAPGAPAAQRHSTSQYDGPFPHGGYSAPKTGAALARQVGIPMSMVKTAEGAESP